MLKKEAVITGLGVLTSLGSHPRVFWENLLKGESGIDFVSRFDPSPFHCKIASEIKDLSYEADLTAKERKLDLSAKYALWAANQAINDSGLDLNALDRSRCGVVLGSARGAASLLEASHSLFLSGGAAKVKPSTSPFTTLSSMSAAVARRFGFQGINLTVSATCASSSHALGAALEKIHLGKADLILAGGSEACLTPFHFAQFGNAGILSTNKSPASACKPFDLRRDGMVIAEGAGVVVVEEKEHALRRGARSYCRLAGFGSSCDAQGITSIPEDGLGIQKAMALALEDAGLEKGDVDYINAHGTATRLNDRIETTAIKNFFGDSARNIPTSSTKSMTGHLLGASGGIQAVICSLVCMHGKIPPTINYQTPDPECDLDYVPNHPRDLSVNGLISNALGFGGLNTCLAFDKKVTF